MLFVLKVVISGLIIAYGSWLAGKKPVLAGFITAIPFVSILAMTWAYVEYRDMAKIQTYAVAILAAIPLSLTFFIPFLIHRWIQLSFPVALALGLACLVVAFKVHQALFRV